MDLIDILSKVLMVSPIPLLSWIFYDRHMKRKDLRTKDLTNESSQSEIVAANLDLYQRMLDDLGVKLETAAKKINDLETVISNLKREKEELMGKIKYCRENCGYNERNTSN